MNHALEGLFGLWVMIDGTMQPIPAGRDLFELYHSNPFASRVTGPNLHAEPWQRFFNALKSDPDAEF
ncbi:MAG TPA: hypothetical protein VGC92_13900, partial [Phenylobacterium sp.]